jgi:lipopolysaccharide/colanic/teichoic acid biosynthesis glycosyltransferase
VKVLAFLATAVLVPLLVNEFTDWLPWFAERLVCAATRALPAAARPRYTDEWLADLDATPGRLSKLAVALRILVRAPVTASIVGGAWPFRFTGKRVLDVVVAGSALVVSLPVIASLALALKATDRGPVFSRHVRIGEGGKPFNLLSFRTMAVDAQASTALKVGRHPEVIWIDQRRDPRVTPFGGWMRRWSLDGLPQLLNVLSGSMSLVGPRPLPPAVVAEPGDHERRDLSSKPGITGLWQVSGRADGSWDEMIRLDNRYVKNRSLPLDLMILWRTFSAIWRRR